jgi:hypothetical protein
MRALLAAVLLMSTLAMAQGPSTYTSMLSYLISVPTAGTNDFIGNVSFRGLGFETAGRPGTKGIGFAFSIRWIYFNESLENVTSTIDNVTVNGNQYRSVDAVPILLHARYELGKESSLTRPFVSVGFGPMYGYHQHLAGPFTFNEYGWQFDIAGEAGVLFPPFGDNPQGAGMILSARYDAGLGTDDLAAISFLSFQVGLAFGF